MSIEPHIELPLPKGVEAGDIDSVLANQAVSRFLSHVFALSPFLSDCAAKEPDFLVELFAKGFDGAFDLLVEETSRLGVVSETETGLMRQLRIAKRRMALLVGLADLGNWWHDAEVTQALSRFAGACVSAAFDFILLEQHRREKLSLFDPASPQTQCGLIVLGMGKLGAGELNYSSDIDLILFFDPTSKITLNTDDPITLLSRMAKQLIKIMQERTADGYVFRTDLRLRPDPSSTPLVIGFDAALNYYEGQGQNWERSAMIKALPIAGDLEAGTNFLKALAPFVWRKYLDFAAINDVHSIKRQIHTHKGHGEIAVYGHNIKLGRGGIREIEFFAQTQQLIAGGRNMALRERGTLAALNALASNGWIDNDAAEELGKAYWFLRAVEHRVQMVRDEQTHTLPETKQEMAVIAAMFGESNLKRFEQQVSDCLRTVERHYAALFEAEPGLSSVDGNLVFTGEDADPETIQTLERMGYERPEDIVSIVRGWHKARVPALRTNQARQLLTELVPFLLDTFSKTQKPDQTVFSFDSFVNGLPAGIQLFAILNTNPELCTLLTRILDAAPRLADIVSRRPHVFDAMLEPGANNNLLESQTLETVMATAMERAAGFEGKLDAARQVAAEVRFQVGTRFFSGFDDWQTSARNFSQLAEVSIGKMLELVRHEFEQVHGRIAGSRICVLAMGRLGSNELTATSDLDLIFLYDAVDRGDESDGKKPLDVTSYYIRLMKRFITAMTAPTAQGVLYPVDFRLRPSGNAGPLATSAQAFFKYQANDAWMWEAQALTRARPVYGDESLCTQVADRISDILDGASQRFDTRSSIAEMRALIDKEKCTGNIWDLKTVAGGLIDLEFIAQWVAIEFAHHTQQRNSTRQILSSISEAVVSEGQRQELLSAYDLYSEIMQLARICIGQDFERDDIPDGLATMLCKRLDIPSLDALEALLEETQTRTRNTFNQIFHGHGH